MKIIFCDKEFNSPLLISSGIWSKNIDQIIELDKNKDIGGIVSKTCTLLPKNLHSFRNIFLNDEYCINNFNLENNGYFYYSKLKLSKPLILSLSTDNIQDLIFMLENYSKNNKDNLVELNVSCHVFKNSFNSKYLNFLLTQVFKYKYDLKIGLKLPPIFYEKQIVKISKVINNFPIYFITCCNSFPNALSLNPLIRGGISGNYVCKNISLSNIVTYKKNLRSNIEIIGCGGVRNISDFYEYITCGATMVQIGTQYLRDKTCFNIINSKL